MGRPMTFRGRKPTSSLDLSRASDEGVDNHRGYGALAIKACPGGAKLLRIGSDPVLVLPWSDLPTVDLRSTKSDILVSKDLLTSDCDLTHSDTLASKDLAVVSCDLMMASCDLIN